MNPSWMLLPVVVVLGCSAQVRSPDDYRSATTALLDTRTSDIKRCYDGVLTKTADAKGSVKVRFTVEHDTGKIVGAKVDPTATTAPAELSTCVLGAMDGLTLLPPDEKDGSASFTWDFQPTS